MMIVSILKITYWSVSITPNREKLYSLSSKMYWLLACPIVSFRSNDRNRKVGKIHTMTVVRHNSLSQNLPTLSPSRITPTILQFLARFWAINADFYDGPRKNSVRHEIARFKVKTEEVHLEFVRAKGHRPITSSQWLERDIDTLGIVQLEPVTSRQILSPKLPQGWGCTPIKLALPF